MPLRYSCQYMLEVTASSPFVERCTNHLIQNQVLVKKHHSCICSDHFAAPYHWPLTFWDTLNELSPKASLCWLEPSEKYHAAQWPIGQKKLVCPRKVNLQLHQQVAVQACGPVYKISNFPLAYVGWLGTSKLQACAVCFESVIRTTLCKPAIPSRQSRTTSVTSVRSIQTDQPWPNTALV